MRDVVQASPGFNVKLEGELEAGDEYWTNLAQTADWIVEIDAENTTLPVKFGISPTILGEKNFPAAHRVVYNVERNSENKSLSFQSRILVREGNKTNGADRGWISSASGIRVFMEGFRVLPYGEQGNDWLSIDIDYSRRSKQLTYLKDIPDAGDKKEDEGLIALRNNSYFGAVFLTVKGTPELRMLVNREGFVPEAGYEELVSLLRTGIDLSVRVRAQARVQSSDARTEKRRERVREETRQELRDQIAIAVQRANQFATEARQCAAAGDFEGAVTLIGRAAQEFNSASESSDRLMTEGSILRVLASVGAQMAGFVHEINGLLGTAAAVENAFQELQNDNSIDRNTRQRLARMQSNLTDLRRSIERQASYLVDVVSPDARRRRSRQRLSSRFDVAMRLIAPAIERRKVEVFNEIPNDLETPPMFPAEITVVLSNLLTNAIKASGVGGRIRALGDLSGKRVRLLIENTGAAVSADDGERWFLPFESTTTEVDPLLGQGMGMGLPITRNLLAEYGASIRFVAPSQGYATAVEVLFQ